MKTDISTYIKDKPRGALYMLKHAVYYGHEHIVRWLLQNGVDTTKGNPHAWDMDRTPLEIAALHGRLTIVRLLLEYSANRHVPALAHAAQNGHAEVAKLLIDTAGEDIDIQLMLHGNQPFHKRRRGHETPLRLATYAGEVEMVRFLLARGVQRHFPVSQAADRGEEEILRLLLEAEVRLGIEKDYTKLLNWAREQIHIPKRISDLLLELSPKTRAAAQLASGSFAE